MNKFKLILLILIGFGPSLHAVDFKQISKFTIGTILLYCGAYLKYNWGSGSTVSTIGNGLLSSSSGMQESTQQIMCNFFRTAGKQIQIIPNKITYPRTY